MATLVAMRTNEAIVAPIAEFAFDESLRFGVRLSVLCRWDWQESVAV